MQDGVPKGGNIRVMESYQSGDGFDGRKNGASRRSPAPLTAAAALEDERQRQEFGLRMGNFDSTRVGQAYIPLRGDRARPRIVVDLEEEASLYSGAHAVQRGISDLKSATLDRGSPTPKADHRSQLLLIDDPMLKNVQLYKFSPLIGMRKRSRLLRLAPGSQFFNPVIECELLEVEFDANNQPRRVWDRRNAVLSGHDRGTADIVEELPTEYEALSWKWSREYSQYAIFISKGEERYKFGVCRELAVALKQLQLPNASRTLWVDAICIDMSNFKDRSDQVRILPMIFTSASRVCIWLGDDDESSSVAFQFINKEIMQHGNLESTMSDQSNASKWLALQSLMQRPWFTRRWVVQEVALAPKATIYCGQDSLEWEDFRIAVELFVVAETATHRLSEVMSRDQKLSNVPGWFEYVSELGASLLVAATANIFRVSGTANSGDSRRQGQRRPELHAPQPESVSRHRLLSLEYLVSSLVVFEASIPHDTIYSLLALACDTFPLVKPQAFSLALSAEEIFARTKSFPFQRKPFIVDYSRPYLEVYRDFISFCIESGSKSDPSRALDILCRPWASEFTDKAGTVFLAEQVSANYYKHDAKRHPLFACRPSLDIDPRSCEDYWRSVMFKAENLAEFKRTWAKYLGTSDEFGESYNSRKQNTRSQRSEVPLPSWVTTVSKAPFALFRHPGMDMKKMGRKYANSLVGLPGNSRNYAASQSIPVNVSQLKFKNRPVLGHHSLYVRGFILDTIEDVGAQSLGGSIPSSWLSFGGWRDAPESDPPDEFWRTLVADRGKDGANPPSYYARACRESVQRGGTRAGSVDTTGLINHERSSMISEFCRRVQSVIWNRQLIRTKRGTLGLTDSKAARGDLVCILYGCSVPVILRRQPRKTPEEVAEEEFEDRVEALKACIKRCEDACVSRVRYKIAISESQHPDLYQAEIQEETEAFNRILKVQKENQERTARALLEDSMGRQRVEDRKRKRMEETLRHRREKRLAVFTSPTTRDESLSPQDPDLVMTRDADVRHHTPREIVQDDNYCHYTFLGESYIHGMMDGAAITRFFQEGLTEHVFELR
jgi:hypothetical protein